MANIIRCKLPDGVHKFSPFTVADYRDFLLVRNDMNTKTPEEQNEIMNDLMEGYFPDIPPLWRSYVFLKVFTSSIGKTKIPVAWECQKCKKTQKSLLNLTQLDLVDPVVEVAGIKIVFNFPKKTYPNIVEMIRDNIKEVSDSENTYSWDMLTDEIKLQVIDAIDVPTFESITRQMQPIHVELKLKCCDGENLLTYNSIVEIFRLLIHPDEVFTFYQINHMLVKHSYDLNSIMQMIPVERSIALSLIEKDNKK